MYKTESGGIVPMESAKHHRNVSEKNLPGGIRES